MADSEYEVRDPEIEPLLRELAVAIEKGLPEGLGFGLLLFDFGPGGRLFYISNAERATMIEAFQEWVRVQKGRGH